jgi:hypothetical protein
MRTSTPRSGISFDVIAAAAAMQLIATNALAQPAPGPLPTAAPPPSSSVAAPPAPPAPVAPPPGAAVAPPLQPPPTASAPPQPPQYPPGYGYPGYPPPYTYPGYGYPYPYGYYAQQDYGPPPPPTRHASSEMMAAGITMTAGGLVALFAGSIFLAASKDKIDIYCDGPLLCGHKDQPTMKGAGITMMIGGGVVAVVGIPLWIVGARRVPLKDADKEKGESKPGAPASAPSPAPPPAAPPPPRASLDLVPGGFRFGGRF